MKHKILLILVSCLLASCALSNQFLQPIKIPNNVTNLEITTSFDTIRSIVNPITRQPLFLSKKGDTIPLNYTVHSVIFKSSSGNNLNGWLLKPKNQISEITILHLHGNGGLLYSQYKSMEPLLKFGFQIFLFDYSGYGFSEGKASRENIIKDATSALSYIINNDNIQNNKIVVYGHSLGGNLAAIIAPDIEDSIDGLIIEGAFSNHKDVAANVAGFVGRLIVREKNDALKTIKDYNKPLLVIHSTEDETIPYEMGKKIFHSANKPKELFTIKKCHMCGPRYYGKEISNKIKKMINYNE